MFRPIVAAAILIAICLSCIGEQDVVKMGTEGAYPPYNLINDDGEVDGFERELGDELCRRANLECVWVTNEWDTIIPNLVAGDYDTIMAGMSITDERDEVIDFTQPYFPPVAVRLHCPGGRGRRGCRRQGGRPGVHRPEPTTCPNPGATLQEYELAPEVVSAVLSGEVDVALVDLEFDQESVDKSAGKLTIVGHRVMLDAGIGVGVRESDSELKDKLDRAIDAMKKDGSLNALIEKWFGDSAETF